VTVGGEGIKLLFRAAGPQLRKTVEVFLPSRKHDIPKRMDDAKTMQKLLQYEYRPLCQDCSLSSSLGVHNDLLPS